MFVVEDNVDFGVDVVEVKIHTLHRRFLFQEGLNQYVCIGSSGRDDERGFVFLDGPLCGEVREDEP